MANKQKPLIIVREEFGQKLSDLINESKLPLCIVRDVLNLALIDVTNSAMNELNIANDVWKKSNEKEESNDVKSGE